MLALLVFAGVARAQVVATAPAPVAPQTQTNRLALSLRNPFADLVTVPIENDFESLSESPHALTCTMNIKPVIPFHLTKDWLLVTRTIIPFIHQEAVVAGNRSQTGFGDITDVTQSDCEA